MDTPLAIEKQVAYIIPFRESVASRKEALQFALDWIYNILPNMEVLIIEQDDQARCSVQLPPNSKKVFIYNKGLFNRSWAFNAALRYTDKQILAFADADAFLKKEDYLACFNACLTFDVVTPNPHFAVNIHSICLEKLDFKISNKRWITFAAMLMMARRSAIEKIGGWDERYEGWGYEDNAISHLIFHRLTTNSFNHNIYHIDHQRTVLDGNMQPKFRYNQQLFKELSTLSDKSLERFCYKESKLIKGDPLKYSLKKTIAQRKKPKFVLAITMLNQLDQVKNLLNSWKQFKTDAAQWEVIIADEGSDDETIAFLEQLTIENTSITLIKNRFQGMAFLYNCLFKELNKKSFDLCFCAQSNVYFKKKGWDELYWKIIDRVGMGHLVFQEGFATANHQLKQFGFFSNLFKASELKDNLFTVTPTVLQEIGFMDVYQVGFSHLAFTDYFYRNCRGGFNNINTPFDAFGSKDYVGLKIKKGLFSSNPEILKIRDKITQHNKKRYKDIFKSNKTYLPWNELGLSIYQFFEIISEENPSLKLE